MSKKRTDKDSHQIREIDKNPRNLLKLKNPNSDIIECALLKDPSLVRHIKNPNRSIQYLITEIEPECIKYINKLDREVQFEMKILDPVNLLKYGRNIDNDILFQIISSQPEYIVYLENPKAELIKKALEGNPQCVTRLKYIPEYLQLKVIDFDEDVHPQISRDLVCENIMTKFGPHSDHFHHEFKKLKLKHGITTESENFS